MWGRSKCFAGLGILLLFVVSACQIQPDIKGRIVFLSYRNETPDLYIINLENDLITRLTHDSALEQYPKWSPSGNEIVFASSTDGQIYIIDSNGKNRLFLASGQQPSWSPDGQQIVYEDRKGHLCFITKNGEDNHCLPKGQSGFLPDWSSSGDKILYTSYLPFPDAISFVLNLDNLTSEAVTSPGESNEYPTWAPDDERFAVTKVDSIKYDSPGVYIVSIKDRTEKFIGSFIEPAWSPDGNWLVGTYYQDNKYENELYLFSQDGKIKWRVTKTPGNDMMADWTK